MKFAPTILLLAMGALFATAQTSTVPTFLSYQGRVTDSAGVLIGNAAPVNRIIQFRLYTAASGGLAIWGESQVATISAGEFSVLIGNGAGIAGLNGPYPPAATPYKTLADIINSTTSSALYVGITVDDGNASTTDVEITPRQQLVAGAFALRAKVAESVATSAITSSMIGVSEVSAAAIQTSAVTNLKIADAAVTSAKIADSNIMASHLASGAVTAAKIDTSTVGLWSVSGTNIYRASGSVAIGTLGASFPLTFAASVGDKIALYGGTAGFGHFGFGVQSGLLQIHSDAITSDVAFGYGTSSNFTEALRIKGTGFVGIGITTPTFPLTFAGSVGDKVSLYGAGNYGFGVQLNALQIHGNTNADDVVFGYGTSASLTETMRIKGSGFVGIGITTPTFPLTFAGSVGDKISLNGAGNYGFGVQSNALQIHGNTIADDVVFGYGTSASLTETMRVKGTGVVGIGTSTPSFPLSFASILGDKIALWGITGNHYGFGIQGSLLQIHTDTSGADIAFGYGTSASFTETMRVRGSGRVGIGIKAPLAPLHVSGGVANSFNLQAYIDTSGATNTSQTRSDLSHSIIADNRIRCGALDVVSDARIKSIVSPSNSKADLATLLRIQITDYKHIDVPNQGQRPQKKVIAQQIEQVYPQAVGQSNGVVPDIYQKAAIKDGWVVLRTDLKPGQRVRIITANDDSTCEVLEVADGRFRTELSGDTDRAFVYGREVSDFRSVDYDAISMLHVSATQALYRQQEVERQKTEALKQKVIELENNSSQKDARISALEARLVALEKLIGTSK